MIVKISGEENHVSRCAIRSRFLLRFLRSSYNTSNSATFYLYIPLSHLLTPLFLHLSIREFRGSKQFLESLPRIQTVTVLFPSSGNPVNYIERKNANKRTCPVTPISRRNRYDLGDSAFSQRLSIRVFLDTPLCSLVNR
jgi:hypothetical protein